MRKSLLAALVFLSVLAVTLSLSFSCMIDGQNDQDSILGTSWLVTATNPEGEPHYIIVFKEDKTYEFLDDNLYVIERGTLFTLKDTSFEYKLDVCIAYPDAIGKEQYSEFVLGENSLELRFYDSPEKNTEYFSCTAEPLVSSIDPYTLLTETYSAYDDTQGENNTYYGYYSDPFNQDSFTEFTVYDSDANAWSSSESYWTSMGIDIFHPNGPITSAGKNADEQWAVRRWISTVTGTIKISGSLKKVDSNVSTDGVTGVIIVDGIQKWTNSIEGTDTTGVTFDIDVEVGEGDFIDFIVSPRANDWDDGSYFTYRIDM